MTQGTGGWGGFGRKDEIVFFFVFFFVCVLFLPKNKDFIQIMYNLRLIFGGFQCLFLLFLQTLTQLMS